MINKIKKIGLLILIIILISFYFVFSSKKEVIPQVIKTNPINLEEEVSETKQISIFLNEKISEKEKSHINVKIDPEIEFNTTWLTNNYKIIPKKILLNNTKYSITTFYKDKNIYNFSFKTQTFTQEDILKYGALQTKDDYDFGIAQKDFFNKYPFYTYMPIKNPEFIVDFDANLEKFIITFIKDNLSEQKKNEITQFALKEIEKIYPTKPIPYYTQL